MTDRPTQLLQTVLENPAADGPRLVMADWLEEHGQGERAELIRVQVELAEHSKCPAWCPGPDSCESAALRRRATELLAQHEAEWLWEDVIRHMSSIAMDRIQQCKFAWHRGFIHQVECQLETWRGRTCPNGGTHTYYHNTHTDCPTCHGVGRVGGIGPLLVRRAPIEAVVVTDRQPFDDSTANGTDGFGWEIAGHGYGQYQLPPELWHMLTDNTSNDMTFWKSYMTATAASAALSTALLQEARETPLTDVKEKVYS